MQIGKGINRDIIKYIAMFTMFLNHFANIFLTPQNALYQPLLNIGYFTAVTMCYFLVEGYSYTHSKKQYALRLLLFAVISQVPYLLAFKFIQLNMMFTLLICFIILIAMERIHNPVLRIFVVVLLVLLSIFSDWALMAPLFTIMFQKCWHSKSKMVLAFFGAFLLFFSLNFLNFSSVLTLKEALLNSLASGIGIIVSAVILLVFYNGQRASWGRRFSKWFFYIFYPAHITILYLIKLIIA